MSEDRDAVPSGAAFLWCDGLPGPVMLRDVPEVLQGLMDCLRGWSVRLDTPDGTSPATAAEPVSEVVRDAEGYRLESPFLDAPLVGLTPAGAICGVIADMAEAFIEADPGCLALHCAAVDLGAGLMLLAGPGHAGKSTLVARLAAEPGAVVFGDDVLPIRADGRAVALGVLPLLRLPLPAAASRRFAAFAERHLIARDRMYGYLAAPSVAGHGTTGVPALLLCLDRRAGEAARLCRMLPHEAISLLLDRDMTLPQDGLAHFERVSAMAEGVTCLRLVYSDLEEAAALLTRAFSTTPIPAGDVSIHPAEAQPVGAAPAPEPVDVDSCWEPDAAVGLRRRDDAVYLWHAGTARYFRLNPVAAAVWHLLGEEPSARALALALSEAFPDQPVEAMAEDVARLLAQMAQAGLIRAAR